MREICLAAARKKLSKIVEEVRRTGQSVTLTKRGEPYVDIVPHRRITRGRSRAEVFAELGSLRSELLKSSRAQIKSDIEAGRN
jgi:prevent-host-death family protein